VFAGSRCRARRLARDAVLQREGADRCRGQFASIHRAAEKGSPRKLKVPGDDVVRHEALGDDATQEVRDGLPAHG
jgi:hypothetical protein